MAKSFNEVQKQKRAQIAERKRATHGDPATKKLKNRSQPLSISGKRKRKPLKKWRREQKEVIQKDLVSMEDVEMVASDDFESEDQFSDNNDAVERHVGRKKEKIRKKQNEE